MSAALLTPTTAASARWSSGFWGDVSARTRDVTIPQIWGSLADPEVSQGLENFLIATGQKKGVHLGPPFMDGDLYKWMEAAIDSLEIEPNPELAERIEYLAGLIAKVQREDGYVHTPTKISEVNGEEVTALADRFNFETYNLGHLITAGVRHHEVTGSESLLSTAKGAARFLSHLANDKPLELARSAICPSHYMAVLDLYRVTRDRQYLELAEAFLRVRDDFEEGGDDNQDRLAVRDQVVVAGHAVRANYLYAGLADLVLETGDAELQAVLERLWHDVVDTKLYLTGGCGALYDGASPYGHQWQGEISRIHQAYGYAYQLPNTTAHAESCANIGMIFWSERMLALTGDAKYADVIERIAYNVLLASIGLDGGTYFYTNAMRQVRDLPFALRRPGDTGQVEVPAPPASDERLRQDFMSCFCCPPNIARALASFHTRAASTGAGGLFVHQYGGSELSVEVDGSSIALREDSNYPWDGRIAFTVTSAEGSVPVNLRIPGWARGATLSVNGSSVEVSEPSSYTRIDREWAAGDEIVLELPMPTRLVRGHRLAEELTGQVAVQRGPLVYAVESMDLPEGVRLEQLALRRGTEFAPVETSIAGSRLLALDAEAVVLPLSDADGIYEDVEQEELQTAPVRLIPYYAWGNRGAGEMSVWVPVIW